MSLSISKAWDETQPFLQRERKLITPIVLALLVVPTVIVGLIRPTPLPGQQPEPGPWMLVAVIALIVSLTGQMAIMRLALGWQGRVADALRLAASRVWIVLAALIILGLLVAVVATPALILLLALSGADLESPATQGLAAGLIAIGFVLFLARFVPMAAIATEEKLGPWRLIKRNWQVTRGSYWRLLGFFLLFFLGSQLLAWAVELVVGIAATLAIGQPDPMTVSRLMVALAVGLVQGLVQTVYAVMAGRMTAQLIAPIATVPEVNRAE